MFKIGDRIKNIDPDTTKGVNYGEYGEVTEVKETQGYGQKVYVEYENGNSGSSSNPSRYYKLIERATENKPIMENIKSFVRNLTLSTGEKLMRKHGLKTDCGEYTQTAKDLVINKLCADSEALLIDTATKFDAELKAEKE